MASQERTLYTAQARSSRSPDQVRIEAAESKSVSVVAPPALDATANGWTPEELYAAGIASCLHQAIAVVASELGADLTDSSVSARVNLEHDGALRYSLATLVTVDLPAVDAGTRTPLLEEAMRAFPLADHIELSDV